MGAAERPKEAAERSKLEKSLAVAIGGEEIPLGGDPPKVIDVGIVSDVVTSLA